MEGTSSPVGGGTPPAAPPVDAPVTPVAPDTEPTILSREQVRDAKDLVEETVDCPEWGGAVVVRSFSKGKQIELQERSKVDGEIEQSKLQMFSFLEGVVNPQFELDDQTWLKEKNALTFDRVLKRIFSISGMAASPEEVEEQESQFRDGSE